MVVGKIYQLGHHFILMCLLTCMQVFFFWSCCCGKWDKFHNKLLVMVYLSILFFGFMVRRKKSNCIITFPYEKILLLFDQNLACFFVKHWGLNFFRIYIYVSYSVYNVHVPICENLNKLKTAAFFLYIKKTTNK